MNSNFTVALVLAAGYSKRFGEQDKRRLQLKDGQTLLATTLQNLQNCFNQAYVVVRADDDLAALGIGSSAKNFSDNVIRSNKSHLGQGASLAAGFNGLRHTAPEVQACAVFLGDMPFIKSETCQLLLAHAQADQIIRPVYNNNPGHPVIWGRKFWPELSKLNGEEGGKGIISLDREHYRELTVADPGVCQDIDKYEDLMQV